MLPLDWLLELADTNTSHQFFVTSYIGCRCHSESSSKLRFWHSTASAAPVQSTSTTSAPDWRTFPAEPAFGQLIVATSSCRLLKQRSVVEVFVLRYQLFGTHYHIIYTRQLSADNNSKMGRKPIYLRQLTNRQFFL